MLFKANLSLMGDEGHQKITKAHKEPMAQVSKNCWRSCAHNVPTDGTKHHAVAPDTARQEG